MSEDAASATNTKPMIGNKNALPNKRPITAKVAPNASAPVSPRKIRAGNTLKYRNVISPPIQTESTIDKIVSSTE